jgi:hypothetical protein
MDLEPQSLPGDPSVWHTRCCCCIDSSSSCGRGAVACARPRATAPGRSQILRQQPVLTSQPAAQPGGALGTSRLRSRRPRPRRLGLARPRHAHAAGGARGVVQYLHRRAAAVQAQAARLARGWWWWNSRVGCAAGRGLGVQAAWRERAIKPRLSRKTWPAPAPPPSPADCACARDRRHPWEGVPGHPAPPAAAPPALASASHRKTYAEQCESLRP